MSTTKNVTYRINGKLITFSITENKDTNQFTARIQSGGEIVAVIEGDKIKNAFENVKKRLPKFFEEERARNDIGKKKIVKICLHSSYNSFQFDKFFHKIFS